MRSEGFLIAERALAQHSDQLAARPPEAGELIAALTAAAPRLEQALSNELQMLLGEDRPDVTCEKVEKLAAQKLHKIVDQVAVNFRLDDACGAQVMASLDFASALALTDQVFGGRGNVPSTLPERLPAAADLTLTRFAAALGTALGSALERPEPLIAGLRSDVLGKIIPAREPEQLFMLRCMVTQEDRKGWELLLVLRQDHAVRLLAESNSGASNGANIQGDRRRPDAAPFAQMPMNLTAVLAEMKLPVSRISALKSGDTIPLAISGQVPLRLADVEIARGQIGQSDGCMALRLTRTGWNKKDNQND